MPKTLYDVMQVCMSGHMITSSLRENPECGQKHCSHCGEKTISACPQCGQEIRGSYCLPMADPDGKTTFRSSFPRAIPKFCINCGTPFPWTRRKIEALEELAADDKSLSDQDREALRRDAPLIVTNNPKSEVAALRIEKIMRKAGKTAAPIFTKIVAELATKSIKKKMGW